MSYLADVFPLRRRSSADWIVPASIGLGLGVAAGVGIGVLLAPQPGDITRRRLRESAERVRERARMAAGKVASNMGNMGERPELGSERSFASDVGGGR